MLRTLGEKGKFYKGNLHLHSTNSDGRYAPEELFRRYKANGYNFLGISDHMFYNWYPEQNTDSFLSIPAAELDTGIVASGAGTHHVVAFGDPATTKFAKEERLDRDFIHTLSGQDVIDYINAHDNMAIYCHPDWSRVQLTDTLPLHGMAGMEIFNYDCQVCFRSGNGEAFYGRSLWHGRHVWCFGTDDGHGGHGEIPVEEFCGGYITVKTEDFSYKGILGAIRRGSFYASASREGHEAPRIYDFWAENGAAHVRCDPARDVQLYLLRREYPDFGRDSYVTRRGTPDAPVTEASIELTGDPIFVRAMVEDFTGAVSWSQPIFLKD